MTTGTARESALYVATAAEALATSPLVQAVTLSKQPVGYWRFNETSGTAAADLSGNGSTATITGSQIGVGKSPVDPTSTTFSFAGGTDQVSPASTSFSPGGNNPFSISAWIKPNRLAINTQRFIGVEPVSNHGVILFMGQDNHWRVLRGDAAAGIDQPPNTAVLPGVGVWQHVVAVYDGTNLNIWVNGVAGSQQASSRVADVQTAPLVMGRTFINTTGGSGSGMCEVSVYNRALGSQDIKDLYVAGRSAIATASESLGTSIISAVTIGKTPLAYYKLNETSGTVAKDSSGNGLNMTINGTPTLGVSGALPGDPNGLAMQFNAGTDSATGLSGVPIDPNWSFSLWIKCGVPTTFRNLLARNWVTSPDGWDIFLNNVSPYVPVFGVSNGATQNNAFNATLNISDGNWHHIVGTYDANTVRLYVDNVQVGTKAISRNPATSVASVKIAGSADGGTMREVSIYRYVLSVADVNDLYLAGTRPLGTLASAQEAVA